MELNQMSSKSRRKADHGARSSVATDDANTADEVPLTPNWPKLQPLVPTQDLWMEAVLQDQIILVRNLFTSSLCKKYVSFLSTLPLITTPAQAKEGHAVRINDRFEVQDVGFSQRLWRATGLADVVTGLVGADRKLHQSPAKLTTLWGGELCGLNPRIRVYRYRKGQRFGPHYDESNDVILPTAPSTSAKTTWTLLIYLTGPTTGCVGGETVFYPEPSPARKFRGKSNKGEEPIIVGLEVGMALLHKHGQECLLHEGREVQDGEKWVIRSDLCVEK